MWHLLAGVIFGVIGGMGMGGGVILIPVLTWFLGAGQQEAQGLNLLCFLPMSVFALAAHLKKKHVDIPLALLLAGGGLAGSLGGAYLANLLESELLGKLFGGFLIGLGLWRGYQWIRSQTQKGSQENTKSVREERRQ